MICANCGAYFELTTKRPEQRFCSKKCRDTSYREHHRTEIKKSKEKWRAVASNKEKILRWGREYDSRPENKERNKRNFREREYGPGAVAHFEHQIQIQKGLCAICGVPMVRPQQDHNHETERLRAALCARCNQGLGYVEEEGFIEKALVYIKSWKE